MGDGGDAGDAGRSPLCKKRKREANSAGDLRRVSEVVMVLSAMAEMRAGKEPTAAERALVAEARERLMEVCEGLRPKDLFLSEAVRVVVEDLGLIPSKDLTKGFRQPKISIAEKVLLTKKKMEEAKESAVHSSVFSSQQFPVVIGAKPDSRGTMLHGDPMNLNKSSSNLFSAGAVQNSSPVPHVPYASSTAVPLGRPRLSETQTINPAINPTIPLPYREATHLRSDARLHDQTIIKEARGISADYVSQKGITTSSGSPTTGSLTMPGQANKSLDHRTIKSEINALHISNQEMINKEVKLAIQPGPAYTFIGHQAPRDLTSNHSASPYTNHNDIAKDVQRVLLNKVANPASWTPPSTEYMTTPLNCQLCKILITDVESLLICDGCEKGTHLKCLQTYGNKDIPKVEWHCSKCLNLSNGKPLPPKYGKVTRTIGTPKAAPSAGGAHASVEGTENPGSKDNQMKSVANENFTTSNAMHAASTGDNHHVHLASSGGTMDLAIQETSVAEIERKDAICSKTISNDVKEGDGPAYNSTGTQKNSSPKYIQNSGLFPCSVSLAIESPSQPMNVSESTPSQNVCGIDAEKTYQSQTTCELQIDNTKVPDNVEAPEDQPRENNDSTIQELKENMCREEASGHDTSSDKVLEGVEIHQEMENGAMDKPIFDHFVPAAIGSQQRGSAAVVYAVVLFKLWIIC